MHLVHWFEIPVNDLDRAQHFYEAVFSVSLTPIKVTSAQLLVFPMQDGAPGAAGALIAGAHNSPSHDGPIVYFSVDDIDTKLKRIENFGSEILLEKTPLGEHGFIAHFEDSEGNRIALHSLT